MHRLTQDSTTAFCPFAMARMVRLLMSHKQSTTPWAPFTCSVNRVQYQSCIIVFFTLVLILPVNPGKAAFLRGSQAQGIIRPEQTSIFTAPSSSHMLLATLWNWVSSLAKASREEKPTAGTGEVSMPWRNIQPRL